MVIPRNPLTVLQCRALPDLCVCSPLQLHGRLLAGHYNAAIRHIVSGRHAELWKLQPRNNTKMKIRDFNKMKDAGEDAQLVNEVLSAATKNAGAPSPVGSPEATPTMAAEKAGTPPSTNNPGDTVDEELLVAILVRTGCINIHWCS